MPACLTWWADFHEVDDERKEFAALLLHNEIRDHRSCRNADGTAAAAVPMVYEENGSLGHVFLLFYYREKNGATKTTDRFSGYKRIFCHPHDMRDVTHFTLLLTSS